MKLSRVFKKIWEYKRKKQEEEKRRSLMAGLLFLLIGGAMTIFAGYLLWDRFFVAPDLEKILPEKDLVMLMNLEELETWSSLEKSSPLLLKTILSLQDSMLGTDLSQLEWKGRRGGVALYRRDAVEGDWFSKVDFVETRDWQRAHEYLISRSPKDTQVFQGYEIYTFDTPRTEYCTLYLKYMACSDEKLTLQNILESKDSAVQKLADAEDFQKIASELPRLHKARVFLRTAALENLLPPTFSAKLVLPLIRVFPSVGAAITERPRSNALETAFVLLRKNIGIQKDISNEAISFQKDSPEILSYLPENANAFLWGNDLAEDIDHGFSYFGEVDPAFLITVKSTIASRLEQFFGGEISWEYDILPLLASEFVVGNSDDGFFAVLKTNDEEFAQAKLEKLISAIKKISARFIPKIVSYALEDGSTVEEVFPDEDAVQMEETAEGNGKIFTFSAKNDEASLFSLSLGQEGDTLFFGIPSTKVGELLKKNASSLLSQKLPLKFAGPSEEVFSFFPKFLLPWLPEAQNIGIQRVSGKIVTTPLLIRAQVDLEF
ncbi:DUF3352 domain-containing protein [Candidatus Peregrinibacteria bacterium]|nr:DUF3352 domain-containing protein [Candidatus Peregrinibacteria bacterium]